MWQSDFIIPPFSYVPGHFSSRCSWSSHFSLSSRVPFQRFSGDDFFYFRRVCPIQPHLRFFKFRLHGLLSGLFVFQVSPPYTKFGLNVRIEHYYSCVQWDIACYSDSRQHSEGCSSYSAYKILFRATLTIHNTAKISDGVHFLQRIWFYFETVLAFCICLEYLDLFVVQILRPISAVLSSNMDNLSSICWWLCDRRAMFALSKLILATTGILLTENDVYFSITWPINKKIVSLPLCFTNLYSPIIIFYCVFTWSSSRPPLFSLISKYPTIWCLYMNKIISVRDKTTDFQSNLFQGTDIKLLSSCRNLLKVSTKTDLAVIFKKRSSI